MSLAHPATDNLMLQTISPRIWLPAMQILWGVLTMWCVPICHSINYRLNSCHSIVQAQQAESNTYTPSASSKASANHQHSWGHITSLARMYPLLRAGLISIIAHAVVLSNDIGGTSPENSENVPESSLVPDS